MSAARPPLVAAACAAQLRIESLVPYSAPARDDPGLLDQTALLAAHLFSVGAACDQGVAPVLHACNPEPLRHQADSAGLPGMRE